MLHSAACLVLSVGAMASSLHGDALTLDLSSTDLGLSISGVSIVAPEEAAQEAGQDSVATPPETGASPARGRPYASQGSVAWWVECSAGTNFSEGWVGSGGVGVEWYPVDGFALGLRLDGIGVRLEDTPATGGADAVILLRWHALMREDWSLYFEGGCGLAYFSSRVPSGAAHLNFTPQIGVGCSVAVDDRARLLAGLRWFHISNGQTASSNPGVDMLSAYVGITMPF